MPNYRRGSKSDSIPSSRESVSINSGGGDRRVSWMSASTDLLDIDHIETLKDMQYDDDKKDFDELTKNTVDPSRNSGSRGSISALRGSFFGRRRGSLESGRRGRRGSGRSSLSSSSQNFSSFWSDLANQKDLWDDAEEDESFTWGDFCAAFWETRWYVLKQNLGILRRNPNIILLVSFILVVFCAASMIMIVILAESQRDDLEQERLKAQRAALDLAEQTGKFFSDQLDRAILPLFSMAQFVQELDIFHSLPGIIGRGNTTLYPDSLPFKQWKELGKKAPTHRDVTGVCDAPDLVSRFNQIAKTIKENSKMEGVLVNVQLAPQAVVCLLYPKNNTEDFEPPVFMDNSGAVGHDLFSDPNRKFIAEATVPKDEVVIAGPLSLVQCFPDCPLAVEQAFIARLAIDIPDLRPTFPGLEIGNETYYKWGFAVVLINWKEMVDRSGVYEKFEKEGNNFQLTRTDQKFNRDTGSYFEKVVVLAESAGFGATNLQGARRQTVSTKLDTTNNEWEMHVEIGDYEMINLEDYPTWEKGGYIGAACVSVVFAYLFMLVLLEKRLNKNVLEQLLPGKSLKLVSRGKTVVEKFDQATVFFSDIVGYTSMSKEMRPIQVMKMLNEFYTELDKIADKHEVYKMETIGDAYMVTGGAPYRCSGPEGAAKVALFAIEAVDFTKNFKTADGLTISIRAGINTGPLVAGVVGTLRPKYTIYGDTVNVASRMESNSLDGRIQVSESTYFQLQQFREYDFEYDDRGLIPIKGKGEMHTWFVNSATKIAPYTSTKIVDEYNIDDDIYLRDIDEGRGKDVMEEQRPETTTNYLSPDEIDGDDSIDLGSSFSGEEYFA